MKIRINQLSKSTPLVTYQESKKQPTKRTFVSTPKTRTLDEILANVQTILSGCKTKTDTIKKEALNRTQYNHLDITNQLKREPKQKAIRKQSGSNVKKPIAALKR
jgi:hypothetical protein